MRLFQLIAFLGIFPFCAAFAGTITVTGQGIAVAEPDMAHISMGVVRREPTAQAAMDAVAGGINSVISSLKESGIDPRDVQTSQIVLYPVWSQPDRQEERRLAGFTAQVSLRVVLRDLDRMGAVLAKVVAVGGNQFNGVSLGVQDTTALEVQARAAAVADAQDKAAQLARAAGVRIVGIEAISEGGFGVSVTPRMGEAALMADTMEIARGESTVTQSVTVVFAFQ